jgi:hypothetical protein
VTGTIDSNNMVTKVETTESNPVLGDMSVVATYSDYKDFNGIKFPTRIARIEQTVFRKDVPGAFDPHTRRPDQESQTGGLPNRFRQMGAY